VPVLARMAAKRRVGYQTIGYRILGTGDLSSDQSVASEASGDPHASDRAFEIARRHPPNRSDLESLAVALLQNEMPFPKPVRLLGISLSSLQGDEQEEPQLGLPI